MRNDHNPTLKLLFGALVLVGAAGISHAANPPAAPAAGKTKAAAPAPADHTVAYDELKQHIGEHVIVHTTLKTTRSGVLTQVSNSQLTLGIEAAGGSTELTIPKNTILSVALAPAPASQPGTPSAKKN
jgi:hypothetical protein